MPLRMGALSLWDWVKVKSIQWTDWVMWTDCSALGGGYWFKRFGSFSLSLFSSESQGSFFRGKENWLSNHRQESTVQNKNGHRQWSRESRRALPHQELYYTHRFHDWRSQGLHVGLPPSCLNRKDYGDDTPGSHLMLRAGWKGEKNQITRFQIKSWRRFSRESYIWTWSQWWRTRRAGYLDMQRERVNNLYQNAEHTHLSLFINSLLLFPPNLNWP